MVVVSMASFVLLRQRTAVFGFRWSFVVHGGKGRLFSFLGSCGWMFFRDNYVAHEDGLKRPYLLENLLLICLKHHGSKLPNRFNLQIGLVLPFNQRQAAADLIAVGINCAADAGVKGQALEGLPFS